MMSRPDQNGKIFVGRGATTCDQYLALALANRHGFIAGATGAGNTVSLQVRTSRANVPVFATDIKGDFSRIS